MILHQSLKFTTQLNQLNMSRREILTSRSYLGTFVKELKVTGAGIWLRNSLLHIEIPS